MADWRVQLKKSVEKKLTSRIVKGLVRFNNTNIIAKAGVKGENALIMGVNNFGDPLHTIPNTKRNGTLRKTGRKLGAEGLSSLGIQLHPIPARPFLTTAQKTDKGEKRLNDFLEKKVPALLAGINVSGKEGFHKGKKSTTPREFYKDLSQVMADNIRENWESGDFVENAPMTLRNKSNSKPLHGNGGFSGNDIKGWLE